MFSLRRTCFSSKSNTHLPMMLLALDPADVTVHLNIQLVLHLCSNAVPPADGTLALYLHVALEPSLSTPSLFHIIKNSMCQCVENNYLHLLFDYCIWGSNSAGQHRSISTATTAPYTMLGAVVDAHAHNHVEPLRSCLKLSSKCILAAHLPH